MRDRTRKTHAALARQVLDLTRTRRMQRRDHLPEQAFASLCGVSRTPIRAAFKLLAEMGFLEIVADGGYCLAVDPEAESARVIQHLDVTEGSLADRILADRRDRRIDEVQSVSFLVRRYGGTRAMVLNALTVLQQDGIVERVSGHGWVFRPMLDTPAAIADSLQFRLILEPAAILTPGFELDQVSARELRMQMSESLSAPDGRVVGPSFHRQDTSFHVLIARGAANRFARDALLAHYRLRQVTQKDFSTPEFRLRQAIAQHLEILDSLERRQFDVAADQMTLHLRLSRNQRPDAANRGSPPMARLPGRAPR